MFWVKLEYILKIFGIIFGIIGEIAILIGIYSIYKDDKESKRFKKDMKKKDFEKFMSKFIKGNYEDFIDVDTIKLEELRKFIIFLMNESENYRKKYLECIKNRESLYKYLFTLETIFNNKTINKIRKFMLLGIEK